MTLSLARDSTPAVTFGDFARRLRESDLALLKGSDYRALNRELKSLTDGPEVRIAYLGNVTLGLLPPYPAVHGAREGWRGDWGSR